MIALAGHVWAQAVVNEPSAMAGRGSACFSASDCFTHAFLAEIFAVGLMLFSRFTYGVSRLSLNNEVAGFKFAVVGVFYAVLLAIVVVAVWEEYQDTETAVRNEFNDPGIFRRYGLAVIRLPRKQSG